MAKNRGGCTAIKLWTNDKDSAGIWPMVGKTLRSYRIEGKLGAGGMGIVYRALDSRLDRTVALKVLPLSAVSSADREKRFVQEAKAASALNHPNIITIYDIDSQSVEGQPVHFIAMEFVAGETLDRLIGHKPLRVRDALKYAIQMADALAAAHAAGIIHRDLKPSNVMVTPQGSIKILDFGLAKLNELAEPDAYAETMRAEAVNMTEPGTILGTAAYMSPEQAEGGKIDGRSDIFSFGSVLYEMVTGRQAFAGGSKISSLSAILHKDPQPVRDTVPDVPEELDRIIGRCLKKDPARRWQTMADVKVALEELREELESGKSAAIGKRPSGIGRRRGARRIVVAALVGSLLGLVPGAYVARRFFRPPPPSFERLTFRHGDVTSAKFAPGGGIVFSAEWDGAPSTLFSTQPGDREARPLGLPPGRVLAIKPDGEMAVLFDQTGTLARVRLGGGAPREVLENVSGADWGPDGESLAVVRSVRGWRQLEYPIGTVLYRTEGRPPTDPRVSPDGTLVAFFDYDVEIGDFAVCVVGANRPKRVLSRGWRAVGGVRWSPNGDEIWFSGGGAGGDPALYAVSLSGKQRMLMQTAGWMVLQDVARDRQLLLNAVNSRLGIMYLGRSDDKEHDLAWLDASLAYQLSASADSLLFVELSYEEGRNSAIYLRKTDGSPAVLLGYGNRPALSPDGKAVLCIRHQPDHSELLILPTGAGESRTLNFARLHYESVEWFPDGKRILFTGKESGHQVRTWTCDLAEGKPKPLTEEGVRATLVSPDGRSFVVPGGGELSLRGIDGGPSKPIVELAPGEEVVRWSGDGQYLFVRRLEGASVRISRVRVATGKREAWREIKAPSAGASFFGPLALSADGKALACTFQRDISNLFLVKGVR